MPNDNDYFAYVYHKLNAWLNEVKSERKPRIDEFLKQLNTWSVNDKQEMIFKKFKFKNFKEALRFINLVGETAEEERHHPDISLGWGYCLIMIHTHAIKGLSVNDFILAAKIDKIFNV